MNLRAPLATCLGALSLLVAGAAGARTSAELAYERGAGTESCPEESELRQAVRARLGEDPFGPSAQPIFHVEIQHGASGFVGRVTLAGEHEGQWAREFEGTENCAELVQAMALAISLAINPELALEPAREPTSPRPEPQASPPPAPVAPEPHTPAPPPPAPPPQARPRTLRWGIGALIHAAIGAEPEPAAGLTLLVRARNAWWSVGLEGRFERALDRELSSGGSVATSLLAAAASPCAHWEWFAGCGVALAGSLRADSNDVPDERSDAGVYAAVGGRVAFEARVSPNVAVVGRLDALVRLTPTEVVRDGAAIWSAPPASAALGVGALLEIP